MPSEMTQALPVETGSSLKYHLPMTAPGDGASRLACFVLLLPFHVSKSHHAMLSCRAPLQNTPKTPLSSALCSLQAIRVFFMLRSLSLQLRGEPETQLPLTREEDLIKTDDVLDLSECHPVLHLWARGYRLCSVK